MLAHRSVHKVYNNSRRPILAHRSDQKVKKEMEANASTLIHKKRKQHVAGGQCLHTEAFTKYKNTQPEAIASTQKRSKSEKNEGPCYHTDSSNKETKRGRRPMIAHRSVRKV
jgi:hypothetical protein